MDPVAIWMALAEGKTVTLLCQDCDKPLSVALKIRLKE
jgi:hypothetical protein